MKKFLALMLALTMAFSLVACGNSNSSENNQNSDSSSETSQSQQESAPKTTLTAFVGTGMCEGNYDPCTGWGMYGYNIFHSALYRIDANSNPLPDVATGFEVSEDGLTYTYTLRDDVRFADGEPLTASDVVFTYLTAKESGSSVDLTMLESAEAPDDTTVVFKLSKPYSVFFQYGTQLGIVPEHAYDENYAEHGLGSGPFKVTQLDIGQQVIVERNEYYHGTKSQFERITFLNLDTETALSMAQSGELDLCYVDPEYADETVAGMTMVELPSVDKYGFNMPTVPAGGTDAKGNPVGNDVTCDIAIRKALNIGIDRQTIINNALNGHGVPAYARVTGLPWCIENPEFEDNRKEEACAILEEAGWIDTDGDGIREKDGKKAEFTLMSFAGANDRYKLSVALSEDAKALGIQINPESCSRDITSAMRLAQPLMGASGSYTPAELTRYRSDSTGNQSSYANATVDEYIDQALNAKTPEEANKYWHLMQSDGTVGINEDVTDIWIIRMPANFYVADGLDIKDSFCFASHHGMPLSNVEAWTYGD